MEAPLPSVRYQRVPASDSEEPGEPAVHVQLYSPSMRWSIQEKHRETCVRIFTALLLLVMALSFAFYQLTHEQPEQQDSEEEKWAFVDDPDWNNTWGSDYLSHPSEKEEAGNQHGKGGKGGSDGEKESGRDHDEEEEPGHHHGDEEEQGYNHGEEEEPGHHHGDEEEPGHHHGDEEEPGHHHGDEEEPGHHHGDEEEPGHHHGDKEHNDEPPAGHTHENGVYPHATVITDSDICSSVGKDILTAGGNVVDAGISALLCLGVVHPHAAGVGGVFSAVFYNSTTGSARSLNAISTQSPSRRYGIPLVLQGLWVIHQQHGIMEWPKLFERPIQLAKKGFQMDAILARSLQQSDVCATPSGLHDLFCNRNGSVKGAGSVLANRKLAEVLQSASSSMKGATLPEAIVQKISDDLSSEAGLSSSERATFRRALETTTVEFESPLSVELDGFSLYAAPPPASGNIIVDILQEVNRNQLTVKSSEKVQSAVNSLFNILNASKHSYAKVLGAVLHGSAATPSTGKSASIKDFAQLKFASVGSHLSTADSHGNMLLISASLNSSFGSKFISPSTGIVLSDFVVNASSNTVFWACPVVVRLHDEEEVLGVGAAGGSSVPLSVAQSIINRIYFEKPLKDVASGPVLKLSNGEDGAFHSSISGLTNTSDLFLSLLDRDAEVTAVNSTGETTPVLLVESHAEHVRAFGAPPSCCHFDGF